jgi:TRAP-type C4-dicarboxylate transport system permease small subunit
VSRLIRAIDGLCLAGAVLGAGLLAFIAAGVFYEVVVRYVFNAPTEWSLEITTYALVWAGFLAAGYTHQYRRHVRVDLLVERLSPGTQRRLAVWTELAALAVSALIVVYGARFVYESYVTEATSVSPLRVPLYLPELAVPIGALLVALQCAVGVLRALGLAPPARQP